MVKILAEILVVSIMIACLLALLSIGYNAIMQVKYEYKNNKKVNK